MGASLRKVEQIIRLAGCDLLTISPDLLEKMQEMQGELKPALTPEKARSSEGERLHLDEKTFRWMHNEDAMAVDKLSEGISKFYADARKLEQYARPQVREKVSA
jgi:transaldolase